MNALHAPSTFRLLALSAVAALAAPVEAQFSFGPRETHLDVGRPGEWNDFEVLNPVVLETEVFTGSPYTMYYTGHGGPLGGPFEEYVVGVAHSVDGVAWTKSVTACLGWGPPGSWDARGMIWHTVVEDPFAVPARFRMYYAATSDVDHKTRIGVAFSSDGKTFTKHVGNPILDVGPPGSWNAQAVYGCSVLPLGVGGFPLWRMWFTGTSDRPSVPGATAGIGTTVSPDGLGWAPASPPLPEWSGGGLSGDFYEQPVVRFLEGKVHLWITKRHDPFGLDYASIHWATSPDGLSGWVGPFLGEGILRWCAQPSPLWDGVSDEVRLWCVEQGGGGMHPRYNLVYDNIAMTRSPIHRHHVGPPYLLSNGIYVLGQPFTITTLDPRVPGAPYALFFDDAFNTAPASIPLSFGVLGLNLPVLFTAANLDPSSGVHWIVLPPIRDPAAVGLEVNFQSFVAAAAIETDALSNPITVHLVRD